MDLSQFVTTGISAWDILFAVLSVLVGWILAHFTRKAVLALVRRVPNVTETVVQFAARFAYYVVLLLGIGLALAFLGANVQPLLGIVIIAVVVAVLVLRGVADNFAAGVLIQTRQTVKVGDEVQVEGPDGLLTGVVSELNSRSILMTTVDGRTVHVPNAKLLADPIVNHSTQGRRRSDVQVRLERSAPLPELTARVTDAVAATPGVLDAPGVRALVTSVSPERVTLRVQFWHPPLDGVPVTSAVVAGVAAAVDDAGWRGTVTSVAGDPPLVPPDSL